MYRLGRKCIGVYGRTKKKERCKIRCPYSSEPPLLQGHKHWHPNDPELFRLAAGGTGAGPDKIPAEIAEEKQ